MIHDTCISSASYTRTVGVAPIFLLVVGVTPIAFLSISHFSLVVYKAVAPLVPHFTRKSHPIDMKPQYINGIIDCISITLISILWYIYIYMYIYIYPIDCISQHISHFYWPVIWIPSYRRHLQRPAAVQKLFVQAMVPEAIAMGSVCIPITIWVSTASTDHESTIIKNHWQYEILHIYI